MHLKIVVLLTLAALAYGLPVAENPKSDPQAINQIPLAVDSYLEEQVLGQDGKASLLSLDEEATAPVREKRACRTIKLRSKSGRIITVKRC